MSSATAFYKVTAEGPVDLGSNRVFFSVICKLQMGSLKLPPLALRHCLGVCQGFASLMRQSLSACSTPANWPYNHESIGKKGWAFLLPTVTPDVSFLAGVFIKSLVLVAGFNKAFKSARMFD